MPANADDMLDRIVAWGATEQPIRVALLVGSRARQPVTDELADLDVSLFAESPTPYTGSDQWITTLGAVWVCIPTFYERGDQIVPTRLVIFDGGIKVDFSFPSFAILSEMAHTDELSAGYRVLLDKDDRTAALSPPTGHAPRPQPPTAAEFATAIDEFWFEAYHVAKYLKRDELWMVKFRDWSTKEWLLKMIEWHAQASHGGNIDTHYLGKQMRQWTDPATSTALDHVFAHFDGDDSWRALLATLDLFRRLASETATLLGFTYPADLDANITAWITRLRAS